MELNPAAERLLQPGGDSSAGESLSRYVKLECQAPLFLAFRSLFNGGVPFQMELELSRGESRDPCLVVLEATVTESRGTRLGSVLLLDITERRVLQEQLTRARRMESIALMTGGVAHRFNNLMNVVGGCCELLMERLPENNNFQRELVRDIQEAGLRASHLTSQLLDIGRRENSSHQLIELNSAIVEIAGSLQRILPEGVELQVDTTAQSLLVSAEKAELERILQNLVANAGDSDPSDGRVRIQVHNKCRLELEPLSPSSLVGTFARIAVSDKGRGISRQRQARMFEPFYSTKPPDLGDGLGLAVVDGIVRRRGGRVEVESEIDKGTTVTFFLPLAQPVSSIGGIRTRPKGGKARSLRTVLIAEDEPAVRRLVERILRADGHDVIVSASGEEALARFISHPSFDLLLTDVVMPGMGGLELALRVRALSPSLPILFMSGYTDDKVRDRMGRIGSGFIGKPFSRGELTAMVRKTCIPQSVT